MTSIVRIVANLVIETDQSISKHSHSWLKVAPIGMPQKGWSRRPPWEEPGKVFPRRDRVKRMSNEQKHIRKSSKFSLARKSSSELAESAERPE